MAADAMKPAVTEARSTAMGVIRMLYASEFIAVTMPPVDVAVTSPFASTVTVTSQSAPPAAQLNAISP